MSIDTTTTPDAYENRECGNCGEPITPGEWCGTDECYMGNHEWTPHNSGDDDE